ncbi:MAG: bifunctional pyr operon transcriptional regulator/uracil phosphoribosyltransferase PyrR [Acidiferrobacter sp.]
MADGAQAFMERHPVLIGIHTGGVWVAERLHERLGLEEPLGTLDISFYRDDFSQIGIHPQVKTSHLPIALDGRHIILVDDVLHTGRTIRAALNEIFDFARPASIALAVLIVRDGRELPVQPDIVGAAVALKPRQHIKLTGPNPLGIKILEKTE